MEATATELQKLAKEARGWFKVRTHAESGEKFWTMKDGYPDWVQDMVREAHDGMFPDDYKYAFVVDALDTIKEADDPEGAASELEADVYTSDLLDWLQSNRQRTGYVDEAIEEYGGEPGKLTDQIMLGQVQEKREVFFSVLETLRNRVADDYSPPEDESKEVIPED